MAPSADDQDRESSDSTPGVPESIDRYTVKRRIGRGGQASVYLAYDPNFDIDVAVKVLEGRKGDREFTQRFRTEARVAARLNHPNIVRVYAYDPDYPYLAMEYCDGGDLTEVIMRRRRLGLREILRIVRKIADALVLAHDNEPPILHRDLKPANVLFHKGEPKVADFGLAKLLGDDQALTTMQGMMGTIRYMSPEQCVDASQVDHRSDLWSLGVILYELLSWTRPFDKPGDSFVNIALKIRLEKPRPLGFDVPGPVAEVVTRCLSKERERRYGSAREIVAAIDAAVAALGQEGDALYPPELAISESDMLAARGARLIDEGQTGAARSVISELRRLSPDDSLGPYWARRAHAALSSEDGAVGASTQRRALELGRALDEAETMLGRGAITDAMARVEAVLDEDPTNSVARRLRGRLEREIAGGDHVDSSTGALPGLPAAVDPRVLEQVNATRHALVDALAQASRLAERDGASIGSAELVGAHDALSASISGAVQALSTALPDPAGTERLARATERLARAVDAYRKAETDERAAAKQAHGEAVARARAALGRLKSLPPALHASAGTATGPLESELEALAAESSDAARARQAARAAAAIEARALASFERVSATLLARGVEASTRLASARPVTDAIARSATRLAEALGDATPDPLVLLREIEAAESAIDQAAQSASRQEAERKEAETKLRTLDAAWSKVAAIVESAEKGDGTAARGVTPGGAFDPLASIRQAVAKGEAAALAKAAAAIDAAPAPPTAPGAVLELRLPPVKPVAKPTPSRGLPSWLPLAGGLALAVLVVAVGLVAGLGSGSASPGHRVAIVPLGEGVQITAARCDGSEVRELLGALAPEGRALVLEPGRYELETSKGPVSFTVPGATTVIVAGDDPARWRALLDALGGGAGSP